jgi:small subunit ribosomal protein S4
MERQKLRMNYGLAERQLLRLFVEARASKGNTADRLVELLERRLDNIAHRAGFARIRLQLVIEAALLLTTAAQDH